MNRINRERSFHWNAKCSCSLGEKSGVYLTTKVVDAIIHWRLIVCCVTEPHITCTDVVCVNIGRIGQVDVSQHINCVNLSKDAFFLSRCEGVVTVKFDCCCETRIWSCLKIVDRHLNGHRSSDRQCITSIGNQTTSEWESVVATVAVGNRSSLELPCLDWRAGVVHWEQIQISNTRRSCYRIVGQSKQENRIQ